VARFLPDRSLENRPDGEMADAMSQRQIWDLWYPGAASQGLSFARARIDAADIVLVHAAPDALDIDVRAEDGRLLARARGLGSTADRPIARLTVRDGTIAREDRWPETADLGRIVILPGGEAGVLLDWWNAEDGSAWRWRVEFSNRR
jgi:hypothetical protein